MAYGYGYNQPYMPGMMQNQYQQRLAQMEQASMPRYEIIHVNGENGARAYQLMPNSSALLLDENNPIVWLAQTDGAGYKTVTPYSIAPYTSPESQHLESLNDRIKRLEDVIYGKSDITENGNTAAGATDESVKSAKVSK